ncbi:MAG: hypothetical protein IJV33_11400 [Bacteroidaceae bacterium]|nr:hypothetical protein [Bacteroidaceae bacterium]
MVRHSFFFFFLFASIYASATNHLTLYLNSGTTLSFPVEEKPQITFEGNVLCINTERYQITDVRKYTFSKNEEVGIEAVEVDKKGVALTRLDGEKIAVSVKDADAAVCVYSSNGIEQNVGKAVDADGRIVLNLEGLMPDVYVISIGSETFKIRKK